MSAHDAHAWRIAETAEYIVNREFTRVTLQLPDELLQHATQLSGLIQTECTSRGHSAQFFVLADTTYNSLSVDEVAAQHVGAQCVIHFGRASMTKLSRLPAYFVFPEEQLDVPAAAASLAGSAAITNSQHVVVFLDQPLLHLLPLLQQQLAACLAEQQSSAQVAFAAVLSQQLEPQLAVPASAAAAAGAGGACCHSTCADSEAVRETNAPLLDKQPGAGSCRQQQPSCCKVSGDCQSSSAAAPVREAAAACSSQEAGTAVSRAGDSSSSSSGESIAGYSWQLPEGVSTSGCCLVWVGSEDAPPLLQLLLTYNGCSWVVYDPLRGQLQEGLPLQVSKALRRRYYLVEKARVANIVGVLVGTLGVAGYRDAVQLVRQAAQKAGKKTYTLLMGKPSPAKLANFPEIEVFVMISDPQGQILDSKEYLSPIITPYEAMLAFSPDSEWDERQYRLDFDSVLASADASGAAAGEGRFSLVDGTYHATDGAACSEEAADGALALRAQEALQITPAPQGRSDLVEVKSAADFFAHKRTYLGLETPLVGAAEKLVEKAVVGRSGRAAGYKDEPSDESSRQSP